MNCSLRFAIFWLGTAVGLSFLASPLFKCWMDKGDAIIQDLCTIGKPFGNLCSLICSASSFDCYLFHGSKDFVRNIEVNTRKMVLKHKDISMLDDEYIESLLPEADAIEQKETFQSLLEGLVTFELNGDTDQDISGKLWPWQNSTDFTQPTLSTMKQILKFAHNDEFKLMQLYHNLQLFPAVLGTCGDIYAVEHVTVLLDGPLLDLLPPIMGKCHVTRAAARIFHYLRRLSAALPLHLCDLQWGHFGAASDNSLRFIDLDAAFTASKLAATQESTVCTADGDCDFFDCRGTCDTFRGRCRAGVSDNISNFCRQLVWPRAPLFGATRRLGLLGAVLHEEEAQLLERCARSRSDQHAQEVLDMLAELERRLC